MDKWTTSAQSLHCTRQVYSLESLHLPCAACTFQSTCTQWAASPSQHFSTPLVLGALHHQLTPMASMKKHQRSEATLRDFPPLLLPNPRKLAPYITSGWSIRVTKRSFSSQCRSSKIAFIDFMRKYVFSTTSKHHYTHLCCVCWVTHQWNIRLMQHHLHDWRTTSSQMGKHDWRCVQ